PDASAAQRTALGERLGGVTRCLLKPFGAFLVAPGGEPLALAQAHDRAGILDRAAKPDPGRIEPHRELAEPRQRGAVSRPDRGPELAAHPRELRPIGLEQLHLLRRLGRGGGGQAVLDPAHARDPCPLPHQPAHFISSLSAASDSSKPTRSPGACLRKSSSSGRRTIASSISGSPPAW